MDQQPDIDLPLATLADMKAELANRPNEREYVLIWERDDRTWDLSYNDSLSVEELLSVFNFFSGRGIRYLCDKKIHEESEED